MGKWAARLAEQTLSPPLDGTDKTARRGLVSVLAVVPKGGAGDFLVRDAATTANAPEHLELSAVAWTDDDIVRFNDRSARLIRWGWSSQEAEALAERLVRRDREADDRVSCTDCQHYRPGRCDNHKDAGLNVSDVGRDLAGLLQRCPGFQP